MLEERSAWEDQLSRAQGKWTSPVWGLCIALLLVFLSTIHLHAEGPGGTSPLPKTLTNDSYAPFLINNIFTYFGNNGDVAASKLNNPNVYNWPKATYRNAVFEEGFLWSGFHRGDIQVGGSHYLHGLQAGRITSPGDGTAPPTADNAADPRYRIYRVCPDINPATSFGAVSGKIHDEETVLINRYTATTDQQVYDKYIADWKEWPAADGAPFEDRNGNGTYEWEQDIPGKPGADQTLWYVANDLDSARAALAAGKPTGPPYPRPIGLEMQRTIWGYRNADALDDMLFQSTVIINKSGFPVDSMYLGQWADVDLGEAHDDDPGCDTLLHLGYVYNAGEADLMYGSPPPAFGFVLLQGPWVASPGDTARLLGRERFGFRNLGLSAFPILTKNSPVFLDPYRPNHWRNALTGLISSTGEPVIDPLTGEVTKIAFPGDPVTKSGWCSAPDLWPYWKNGEEIRILVSSGPFTLAPGDTQEVVFADLLAKGNDRLSSLAALKHRAATVRSLYRDAFRTLPPVVSARVGYPSAADAAIDISVDCRRQSPTGVVARLVSRAGGTIADVTLFDDGAHGDGAAGDKVWGNTRTIPRQNNPLSIRVELSSQGTGVTAFDHIVTNLMTAGQITIDNPVIFAENVIPDGQLNLDELIRFGVTVWNQTPFTIAPLTLTSHASYVTGMFIHFSSSTSIASLGPGATHVMQYDPTNAGSYFTMEGYATETKMITVPFRLQDGQGNSWDQTLEWKVVPGPFSPQTADTLLHRVAGSAPGSPSIIIVDPSQLRGHTYLLQGTDSVEGAPGHGITLRDATDGRVLLLNQPLPDNAGFNMPLTDGFRIARGTLDSSAGRMEGFTLSSYNNWYYSYVPGNPLKLEGFGGQIGNAFEHWPSGGVEFSRQHSVLIRFAGTDTLGTILDGPADTTASFGYRYLHNAGGPPVRPEFSPFIKNGGSSFAYQDYTFSVPFSAYDVDVSPPRRLMVGYTENNAMYGRVDGRYFPPPRLTSGAIRDTSRNNVDGNGPREWFFIFDVPYATMPDPALEVDIMHNHVPLIWFGHPMGPVSDKGFSRGTFTILAGHPASAADQWSFTLARDRYLPSQYVLDQNFPNPFNPATTIRYVLAWPARVTLKVYDLLGRQVKTLKDEVQYAGSFAAQWDGTNESGSRVASGVYFYRLDAQATVPSGESFVQSRKMLVLR